jgi:hypothetical protein
MRPTVQWQGDNAKEIERFLSAFVVRADRDGENCRLIGLKGLNIVLAPGDSVVVEGERLGVLRSAKTGEQDPEVTWEGSNLQEVANFMKRWKVRLEVVGVGLFLYSGREPPIVLKPGDKLIERHGKIVISKAGKDHQAE